MTWLRLILTDLAEKRLWPVVGLLIAGTVALSVFVAHSGGPTPVAPPAPAAGAIAASGSATASPLLTPQIRELLAASGPGAGALPTRGRLHDPFVIASAPKAPSGASASAKTGLGPRVNGPSGPAATKAAATGSAGKSGATPQRGSTIKASSGHPVKATKPTTSRAEPGPKRSPSPRGATYTVALRFGQAASLHTLAAPVRLTPLPSAQDPRLVYLGVRRGGSAALFLLADGAQATGDGSCLPSGKACQVIALKPGGTEFIDVTSPVDGLRQYELDLVRIGAHRGQSRAAAIRFNGRVSQPGRAVLRRVNSPVVSGWSFSAITGVISFRRAKTAGSSRWLPSAPAAAQPPTPASTSPEVQVIASPAAT